jgi:hypothetical protein
MEYKKDIEMVIKRYEAFWNKDKLDRIPIRIRFPVGSLQAHESYYEPKAKINESERWEDIVLDPEKYLAYWDRQLKVRAPLMDDSIPTASVDLGPALMCGIMGADITFASGASWSNDPLENWEDIDNYSFNVENKWVRKLIELAKYFVEHSEGKFAVGLANIMGPTDILTCLRGATQTCIDLYEFPDEVIKLIEKCTQAYIETIKIQLDIIPRYYGGTCEGYSMWTPGRSNWLANDLSTMISPETYRNFMFKYDQEIVDYLDSCWMHVHSGGAYMIEEFLKLQNLKGVQIVSDKPSGPDLKDLLPIMKKIQNKHCLILRKFNLEEIKEILPELSPNKLFIDTQGSSFPEAEIMLQEWDLLTRRM